MHLTPREQERLLLAAAADLGRRRLARGAPIGATGHDGFCDGPAHFWPQGRVGHDLDRVSGLGEMGGHSCREWRLLVGAECHSHGRSLSAPRPAPR